MIKTLIGEIQDDCELVVIEHPIPGVNSGLANAPKHAHHDREVICKKDATEINLEPLIGGGIGHDSAHRYVRSKRVDSQGRPIFVEAK